MLRPSPTGTLLDMRVRPEYLTDVPEPSPAASGADPRAKPAMRGEIVSYSDDRRSRGLRTLAEITGETGNGTPATFNASGKAIEFAGYLRAYVEGSDDPSAELLEQDTVLPKLAVGAQVWSPDKHGQDLIQRGPELLLVTAGNDDVRPGLGHAAGHRLAQPLAAPGHQGDAPAQVESRIWHRCCSHCLVPPVSRGTIRSISISRIHAVFPIRRTIMLSPRRSPLADWIRKERAPTGTYASVIRRAVPVALPPPSPWISIKA